jgi:hypothetical protein
MIKRKLKKTEGGINSGQSRDTGNIGHKTQNEDKQRKHTTIKAKKRSNTFNGKYYINYTDDIFSRIKGNYEKIIPLRP